MTPIKIGGESYSIPTSWNDITYLKFCEIITFEQKEDNHILSIISGIPFTTIKNIDSESLILLENLLNFTKDLDTLNEFSFVTIDVVVGKQSWEKLEMAKQAIAKKVNYMASAGDIIKIYCGRLIYDEPITKVWGDVQYILKELNSFFERYKRLGEYEEDEDEFMANPARFARFGFMAKCIELSRSLGQSYDTTLNMSAFEVYETFLYDFERNDYEKTLMRIRANKK